MILSNIRNIYILGDLHLGVKNGSVEWFDIQKYFLTDWFIKTIIDDGFDPDRDILIQLGDWNHVRESTNVRISNAVLEICDVLSETFKKGVHIVLGNHDVYYKDRTDIHSLKEIGIIYDNIYIHENPEILKVNGKHNILLMPWEHDTSELSKKVALTGDNCDYLMCHADVKDFKLNKWTKIEKGLSDSDLKSFKHIYSGHIHIRQSKNNVTYVGTPYQLDRGDANNTKGFYKLNVEGSEVIESFIENTVSPKFIKVNVDDVLNMSLESVSDIFNNNYVDILISNDLAKIFPMTRFLDLLKDVNYRGVEFYPYSSDKTGSEIESIESYDYNIFDVLNEHLKHKGLNTTEHNLIVTKFKEIYDNARDKKYYD